MNANVFLLIRYRTQNVKNVNRVSAVSVLKINIDYSLPQILSNIL